MKIVKSLFGKLLAVAALVFTMTVSVSADEYAPAVFKTTPFEAVQNGTVSTVLYLEENSNLIDFEFQLEYDAEFVTLQSAEQVEDLVGDMTVTEKDGAVHISYTRTSANLTKRTDLAVLTFTVDENVGPERYDFLRVDEDYQSEAHTMMDGELYALPMETEFAPLNIYNFGDVDLSHTVSIADVTYLRQHLAEIRMLSDYQLGRADAYYDTEVSIADAVRIQQYLADKSMLLGNRVNVTFMDKDGSPYRVKSVVQGSGLASIPALPTYSGYYGGVWSVEPDEVVGSDFQNLMEGLKVYAIYKKDASPAVTFYKERLTDVYYAQSELTGNLNLVNKLTWQDGYTADIYWSSSNSAVLNASTGVYNKPSFDTAVTLTATIISYQDGSIEAQDYIAFEFNAAGDFLCPTKDEIAGYLSGLFVNKVESNMILPTKITNADMEFDSKFEVRLSWVQQNADGTEQSVVQLERANNEQTVNLIATATFNGQPLEDDGKLYFDNIVIAPITISEVRSHIVTRIAATSGQTVTENLELLGWDDKYATTIVWESKNTKVADVDDNVVHIKDVVNGTACPLVAHVTYECAGAAKNFDLAYTVNVVTSNTTLVPGTNIDPALYDALKSATGVSGNLTTDALKDVKFVYLDLSGYPEIEDLSALTYCTNLRVLNISGLQVDETSLNQIVTLSKLEALIASNCGIDSLEISGVPLLDKMINLQMLDLSHNKLTSLDGVLSRDNRYGQLLELFLHDNELTDISALCEVVENTIEIKDQTGAVTGTYTENVMKNRAPMLRFLTLDNNYLGDEDLVAFGNFKVLKYLSLGHNNITSVSSLKNVRTLLELHLQDNRIEDVRDLRYLDHLQSLYLGGNNIRNVFSGSKEVNVSYLKYLTDLEILYLEDNYIEDISDLDPLNKLLVLNVNNNRLQDLSVLADKGETLVELYAENNDIDSFSFVRGLPKLTRLMLANNGSVYEASLNGYLSRLTKLRTLTLSGKDLRSLTFLSAMPELVRLDVADCNLPSYTITSSENNEGALTISGYFDNVAAICALRGSLQYLDVSNNGFAYGEEAMKQYLAANGKQVDSVAVACAAPITFENLYEMTELKALYADNLADPVNAKQLFSVMNGLRYLSMENCGITDTSWLSKFRGLIYLDLAGNELAGFDLGGDIAVRSRATLEYLYVDSAVDGTFANAYADFDGNVLKEFSAANMQVKTMESMPDMSGLTYLNLANSGITDLSGNAEFEGRYNLSRYENVETLDVTGVQSDLDEVEKLTKLQTLYAVGGVEDTVFLKQNLLTLYELDKAGVACYLYGYDSRYLPNAEKEGGLILGRLEDYSRKLTVAADGVISDNNPTFAESVNNFDIEWTLSNNVNYAIVDNRIVVRDYTDLDDEQLTVTATIKVYPDQEPVSRDFVMDMDILRADKMDYIRVNAENAQEYLTRGQTFTYDVSCMAAETKGFETAGAVLPVCTDIVCTVSALAADGETTIPYTNLLVEGENHTYTIDENAPLGARLTIKVEVGHTIGNEFVADLTLTKEITIADRVFTLTLVPNGGIVTDKTGDTNAVRSFSEETVLFETFWAERPGFIFEGWYTDAECSEASLFWVEGREKPAMPSNDLTLYAKWKAHSFNVYFDANSGEVKKESMGVLVDTPYGELPVPTKTGYTFLGWFTEKDGGERITAESIVAIESDQTLYAHWQVNTYTVTFNANGGDVSPTSKTVTYGQPYGDLPKPGRIGFGFNGWKIKDANAWTTADTVVTLTEDHELQAAWYPYSYSSSWTASGTGYSITVKRTSSPYAGASIGTISSGTTLYYGDVLSVTYSAHTGYSISGHGSTSITVTGNVTSSQIYMSVKPNDYTYTIWYRSSNGTHLTTNKVTYPYGTTNTIVPIDIAGYQKPASQTVTWDVAANEGKTITFYYPPSGVSTFSQSGNFMSSSPKITYSVWAEYQNRTANSVQVRFHTTVTMQSGWTGFAHGVAYKATCGSVGSGMVKVASYNALSKAGSSSSGSSGWITVPLNTTGATSASFSVYMYQINTQNTDLSAGYGYSSNNYTWTVPIPAY